jgi:tellurite resistance protein TerC
VRQADSATGLSVGYVTPLFVALCLVEFADVAFAADSIPAIFAITTDPFIVYTSNIFAILGLRSLYFVLGAMVQRFRYLKYALALILVFIGGKVLLGGMIGKIPPTVSLSVTLGLIAGGVLVSMWKARDEPSVLGSS